MFLNIDRLKGHFCHFLSIWRCTFIIVLYLQVLIAHCRGNEPSMKPTQSTHCPLCVPSCQSRVHLIDRSKIEGSKQPSKKGQTRGQQVCWHMNMLTLSLKKKKKGTNTLTLANKVLWKHRWDAGCKIVPWVPLRVCSVIDGVKLHTGMS